jgi:hypothetical protein
MLPQRRLWGGGHSLERTALPQIFPANREINREIAGIASLRMFNRSDKPQNLLNLWAAATQGIRKKQGIISKYQGIGFP